MKKLLITCFVLLSLGAFAQNYGPNDTSIVELLTFESESIFFRQGSPTTNIWQIGSPSKISFHAPHSAPNAIVTDTLNIYPVNNHSYFDLIIDFTEQFTMPNLGIGFYHKINTPLQRDGGFITVSYDKGKSWINIIQDTTRQFLFTPAITYFPNVNLYAEKDTLANGESGFSGQSSDWVYTEFYWVMNMVTKSAARSDTLMLRFNFYSDSIAEAMDGWMIDDMRIFYNHDFGAVSESSFANNFKVFPNPSEGEIMLKVENFTKVLDYTLINILGEVIHRGKLNDAQQSLNIEKEGIYFITLTDGLYQHTQKFIIH